MGKRNMVGRRGVLLAPARGAAAAAVHNHYLTGVLIVCAIDGIWAASWDFFSGLTGRENFGHALFIGGGAYAAAFLNGNFGLDPWFSIPAAIAVAVVLGAAGRAFRRCA